MMIMDLFYRNAYNNSPPNNSELIVSNGCLFVDGKPFVVERPDEPIIDVEDNKLVTCFRGHLLNYWAHDEIEGYWA